MGWNYTSKKDFPGEAPDWLVEVRRHQALKMRELRTKRMGRIVEVLAGFMDDQSDLLVGEDYIEVVEAWLKYAERALGDDFERLARGRGGRWLAGQLGRHGMRVEGRRGRRMVVADPDVI